MNTQETSIPYNLQVSNINTILVTGANGQVGMELRELAKKRNDLHFIFVGREDLSIADKNAVTVFFEKNKVDACVNCAAYTAVDKAETEKEQAFAVNATGAGILAEACKKVNARFVHISTDYVFPGNGTRPYKEDDDTHPINVYAASKLEGEKLVMQFDKDAVIIRTSWVYSSFGKNFVKTMQRLMSERESIGVVVDQMGSPTYAADLADAALQIITGNEFVSGIYHYCNNGVISWFDLATEIKKMLNSGCIVNPIPSEAYPTPALRPHYSALDTSKIRSVFGIRIPDWDASLQHCIDILIAQ